MALYFKREKDDIKDFIETFNKSFPSLAQPYLQYVQQQDYRASKLISTYTMEKTLDEVSNDTEEIMGKLKESTKKFGDDSSSIKKSCDDSASSIKGDDSTSSTKKFGDDSTSSTKKFSDDSTSSTKKFGDDSSSTRKFGDDNRGTKEVDDSKAVVMRRPLVRRGATQLLKLTSLIR